MTGVAKQGSRFAVGAQEEITVEIYILMQIPSYFQNTLWNEMVELMFDLSFNLQNDIITRGKWILEQIN